MPDRYHVIITQRAADDLEEIHNVISGRTSGAINEFDHHVCSKARNFH
jgi:hypothetical protein